MALYDADKLWSKSDWSGKTAAGLEDIYGGFRTGTGWLSHINKNQEADIGNWLLDPDKQGPAWKTKWQEFKGGKVGGTDSKAPGKSNVLGNQGLDIIYPWAQEFGMDDPYKHVTGEQDMLTTGHWTIGSPGPQNAFQMQGLMPSPYDKYAVEVIDWDAYGQDDQYKKWLEHSGKSKYAQVSDITEAEKWFDAGMPAKVPPPHEALPEGYVPPAEYTGESTYEPDIGFQHIDMDDGEDWPQEDAEEIPAEEPPQKEIVPPSRDLGDDQQLWNQQIEDQQEEIKKLQDELGGFNTGEVPKLDDQLAQLDDSIKEHLGVPSDKTLDEFTAGDYLSKDDLDPLLTDLKTSLTTNLTDQGADIGKLQTELTTAKGDLKQLTEDWSGVHTDLDTLKTDLDTYTSGLTDLDATWDKKLSDVKGELGTQFGKQIDQVANDAKSWRDNWQAEDELFRTDVEDRMSAIQTETDASIASVRGDLGLDLEQAVEDIHTELGKGIQGVATTFQTGIDAASKNFNDRLSKLSSSMNYRMLGDSAMGVRMRKSRARKEGSTRHGTGQLNRSM